MNRYPRWPRLARAGRLRDLPLVRRIAHCRWLPQPSEAYNVWDACYPGFSTPCRTLRADDVTPWAKQAVRRQVALCLRYHGRSRFLGKLTGWSRIGFLNEIFPDALFIHLLRDGRAVASSLLRVGFWWGWRGPHEWRWGLLSPEDEAVWRKYDYSFVILAGLQWKTVVQEIRASSQLLSSDRFLEIRYEDAVRNPVTVIREVSQFCDLDWPASFNRHVRSLRVEDVTNRWQRDLTEPQQEQLNDVLADCLATFGYEVV